MNEQIKERWHEATNELINKLENKGIDFSKLNAIELFGRDGTWQTKKFAEKVKDIEIWEINPKWENKLKENIPNAVVKIRDSISMLKTEGELPKFDLIIIDNPMNVFGNTQKDSDVYCEHFEVLENFHKLPKDWSIQKKKESKNRIICDYISGMTDRYASKLYKSIYE